MNFTTITAIVKITNFSLDDRNKYSIECRLTKSRVLHLISYFNSSKLVLELDEKYLVTGRIASVTNGSVEIDAKQIVKVSADAEPFSLVTVAGRLGKDPEVRNVNVSGNNKDVSDFSLAVNNPFTKATSWYNCTAWGATATNIAKFVKKGSPLLVSGALTFNTYDAQGETRESMKLTVSDFQLFPNNKSEDNRDHKASVPAPALPDIPF